MKTPTFCIGSRPVGNDSPTYFIADIAANHDGDFGRAVKLIKLAAEAGADAAKFQNFRAAQIVSDYGFRSLGGIETHQSKWEKSVFEVYLDASLPWEWTSELRSECERCGIDYFSTPYDFGAVKMLSEYVPAFKIGSGDLNWLEMLEAVALEGKPVLIATGASDLEEVRRAVEILRKHTTSICVMQCNTNYTGSIDNFAHINLRVLEQFRKEFPDVVPGLSDHTAGHATVLGAVALGARVIEKHFTDDPSRTGPDHHFSMTPASWRDMVDRVRELELALGVPEKFVATNELETLVVQRRCVRAAVDLEAGRLLTRDLLDVLRPAEPGAIGPGDVGLVLGRRLAESLVRGQAIHRKHLLD